MYVAARAWPSWCCWSSWWSGCVALSGHRPRRLGRAVRELPRSASRWCCPIGAFWSLAERTRAGTAVLLLGASDGGRPRGPAGRDLGRRRCLTERQLACSLGLGPRPGLRRTASSPSPPPAGRWCSSAPTPARRRWRTRSGCWRAVIYLVATTCLLAGRPHGLAGRRGRGARVELVGVLVGRRAELRRHRPVPRQDRLVALRPGLRVPARWSCRSPGWPGCGRTPVRASPQGD